MFSRNDGVQSWPAIVSLAESPKRAGLIYAGTDDGNLSVTRDGVVFAVSLQPGGGADILTIGSDGTPRPWLATPAGESGGQLSPDDRFLVYQSDKSGRVEIYVRPVSGRAPEQQVSVNGGGRPGWSADGRAIIFHAFRRLHRADFHEGRLSRPVEIYANPRMVLSRTAASGTLALTAIEEERPLTTLNLVVGWLREVRGRIEYDEDVLHVIATGLVDATDQLQHLSDDLLKPAIAHGDHAGPLPPGIPEHFRQDHPRNVRVIPKSRDFH